MEREGKPPVVMELEADVDATYTATSGADGKVATIDGVDVKTTFRSSATGEATQTYRGHRLGTGFGRAGILDSGAGSAAIERDVGHFDAGHGGVAGPKGAWSYERGVGVSDLRSIDNVKAMVTTAIATDLLTLAALEYVRKVALDRADKAECGYKVTVAIDGRGVFATHDAAGRFAVELTPAAAGAGKWSGSVPAAWTALVFTSKTECPYVDPVTGGTFTVDLALTEAGALRVTWTVDAGGGMSTASVDCPPSDDYDPPPIPGQPGPALIGTGPTTFELPAEGGSQPITRRRPGRRRRLLQRRRPDGHADALTGPSRRLRRPMGKVVKLESGARQRAAGSRKPRGRPVQSKTALVLGGGGFTGAVYEIGALRALDLLSVNRSVNQFDVYVGTSAGALVAALTANGVTPEQMMRVVNNQAPSPFPDINLDMLLRPNYREFVSKGVRLPLHLLGIARNLGRSLGSFSSVDLAIALAEALPSGLYSGSGLEEYVRTVLADPDRTDDFRLLESELYLAATDLDTCERLVLGAEGWDDVPISLAVRASAALPMVYKPVEVRGRELIDGGIVSTTNLDIAVEAGAKFIVVVNPLVPYVNDFTKEIPTLLGTKVRRVSDMGFPKIAYQTFKLLAYQRLHEMARQWQDRYPGVDIVLIEPEPDDEMMFQTNILNYTSRLDIARHGFESVTVKLASDYEDLREVAQRHGIEISATRVRKVVRHFEAEKEKSRAWRRILEQTTGALLRQSAAD